RSILRNAELRAPPRPQIGIESARREIEARSDGNELAREPGTLLRGKRGGNTVRDQDDAVGESRSDRLQAPDTMRLAHVPDDWPSQETRDGTGEEQASQIVGVDEIDALADEKDEK